MFVYGCIILKKKHVDTVLTQGALHTCYICCSIQGFMNYDSVGGWSAKMRVEMEVFSSSFFCILFYHFIIMHNTAKIYLLKYSIIASDCSTIFYISSDLSNNYRPILNNVFCKQYYLNQFP